jgi:hypothetical protein
MNERTRILKLVEGGKITPDEAAMLLEALAEVEAPRRGSGFTPTALPIPSSPPEPPQDWGRGRRRLERLTEAARQLGVRAEEIGRRVGLEAEGIGRRVAREFRQTEGAGEAVTVSYPSHLRWLKVEWMHGDLEVGLDSRLEKPSISGDVRVEQSGQDLLISSETKGGRRTGRGSARVTEMDIHWDYAFEYGQDPVIRVPEGWGLACEVIQGDLLAQGLPYVRGSVRAGDATLQDVGGVDLEVSGDLKAELRLTDGEHHISVLNGDAHIVFWDGSVKVEGSLLNGQLDPRGNFEQRGSRASGAVGEGKAHLHLEVLNGDLVLEDQSHPQKEEEV